jgi:hypothetical protein
MNSTVWTIGHSTRPLKTFLALLEHYRLEAVADVGRLSFVPTEGKPLAQERELASKQRLNSPA